MRMPVIAVSDVIVAPAPGVWLLLTDTRRWTEWGPSVRAVACEERFIRAGSRGRVRTVVGVWVNFEITAFEPGRYWAWRVAGIPATGHRVEPLDDDRCRLVFEVPLPAAPYALICRLAMARIARLANVAYSG